MTTIQAGSKIKVVGDIEFYTDMFQLGQLLGVHGEVSLSGTVTRVEEIEHGVIVHYHDTGADFELAVDADDVIALVEGGR